MLPLNKQISNLKMINYPITYRCFFDFLKSDKKYEKLYKKLGCPSVFDVTLRDGLQSLDIEKQKTMDFIKKKNLYQTIYFNHYPKNIEVGSLVSNKIFPVFNDSMDLLSYIEKHQESLKSNFDYLFPLKTNNYILVPNSNKLREKIYHVQIKLEKSPFNYSFITSTSNSFQCKNIRMSLDESDQDILNMIYMLDDKFGKRDYQIKLYVSCINECPIEGKLDSDLIIDRLLMLNKFNVDIICLSDTCGTLEPYDFKYIMSKCIEYGIPRSKMSLHLHVKQGREDIVEELIHIALDYGIIEFDVSLINSGGCSVTMDKNRLVPNLSYDLFYKSLTTYLINNS